MGLENRVDVCWTYLECIFVQTGRFPQVIYDLY